MSETSNQTDGINISINNADSNSGGGGSMSFLDRLFDIGLKLIIPLGLILALIAIVIVVKVVLPLVGFAIDLTESGIPFLSALGPVGSVIGGIGAIGGWLVGR